MARWVARIAWLGFAASLAAQQPNSGSASLLIQGAAGPPFPIAASVRTSLPASVSLGGATLAPFALVKSATGGLQLSSVAAFGGVCDLPLSPPPLIVLDGFASPGFQIGATGTFQFTVQVPPAGPPPLGIPVGYQDAFQAVVAAPQSPFGFALSAATLVTITQGPVIIDLTLGEDGAALLDLTSYSMAVPFYGVSQTQAYVCANGFVTFGLPDTDYTPTPLEFNSGYPRIAGFWSDLSQQAGQSIRWVVDPTPGPALAPWVRAEFSGVTDWGGSNPHTFSMRFDTAGVCELSYALSNAPSGFETLCGIGPGFNLNPQAMKDLSTLVSPNSAGGLLNESFYEWFGTPSMTNYTPNVFRPFDLFGVTVHFVPAGGGTPLQATSQYVIF